MIGLDSWIFLEYYTLSKKYKKCKKLILSKKIKIISTIALMEIKYKVSQRLDKNKAREIIHDIITSPSIIIVDVNRRVAERAASLRLKYYKKDIRELSYSDCIHLATSIISRCKTFYSGDSDFKDIEEIKTVII